MRLLIAIVPLAVCGYKAYRLWGPLPKPGMGGNSAGIDFKAWGEFAAYVAAAVCSVALAF